VTQIVGIHGIGHYPYLTRADSAAAAADQVGAKWTAALTAGLAAGDGQLSARPQVRVAYYAHHLHRGTPQGGDDPAFLDQDAQELLVGWVGELLPADARPIPQGQRTAMARAACDWLSRHLGDQVLRFALKFVREASTYLSRASRRQAVRDEVAEVIGNSSAQVVIAHSLGSVVAYETLWQHPEPGIDLLLTLGSPLAMPKVIFDRLDPRPQTGRGRRLTGVGAWANLADIGDIVAIPRTGLAPRFDGVTHDNPKIVIGQNAFHSAIRYLAAPETAKLVAPYLLSAETSAARREARGHALIAAGRQDVTAASLADGDGQQNL
jgi:hypothetical protein